MTHVSTHNPPTILVNYLVLYALRIGNMLLAHALYRIRPKPSINQILTTFLALINNDISFSLKQIINVV